MENKKIKFCFIKRANDSKYTRVPFSGIMLPNFCSLPSYEIEFGRLLQNKDSRTNSYGFITKIRLQL